MHKLETLNGDVATNLVVIPDTSIDINKPIGFEGINNYKIVIGNVDAQNTFEVNWNSLNEAFNELKKLQKGETLLIKAIRNFIRKTNISELNEALNDEDITDDEYDAEIHKNACKYVITLNNISSPEDAIMISELVQKIGFDLRDLSTSEVSELFSVKENQLVTYINKIKDQLK